MRLLGTEVARAFEQDLTGQVFDHSQAKLIACSLVSALTGSLTFSGVTATDGSTMAWVIAPGSTGVSLPPGNPGGLCNRLSYVYSNSVDSGKAWVAWVPL